MVRDRLVAAIRCRFIATCYGSFSLAVIACISATMMLLGVAPIARADTFTYNLNNRLTAQDGEAPDTPGEIISEWWATSLRNQQPSRRDGPRLSRSPRS
jgi:hypothetical protein